MDEVYYCRFVEVTMSSQPIKHKERVNFVVRQYLSYLNFAGQLNTVISIIVRLIDLIIHSVE